MERIHILYVAGQFIVRKGSDKYPRGAVLDPLEVAYLLHEDKAVVFGDGGKILTLKDLATMYADKKEWWLLFTVLHDLYKRGRVAKRGFGENDLVLEREGKRYQIYVTEENVVVPISELLEWVDKAFSKNMIPVIAVVDMYGDVTYYKASKHFFKKIDKSEI
ncbi:MAG: hypothetical protein ACP5GI_07085 [Sulfolobales archaeon]